MKNIYTYLLVAVVLICGFYYFTNNSTAGGSFIIEKINNSVYSVDRDNAVKVLPPEKRLRVYVYRIIVYKLIDYKKYLKVHSNDAVIELGNRPDTIVTHIYTNDVERVRRFLKEE